MKLLWLDLNCSYVHASLALPALHAQCGNTDVQWEALSGTLATPVGTLVEQIIQKDPDIIAGTAWLFNHDYLLNAIVRIKALLPHVIVVLGGPEFLGENEGYLRKHPEVDLVLRGEGEKAFSDWLKLVRDRERWGHVPGMCFLNKEGGYHDGGLVRVADFSALTPPEESRFFHWDKPFVQLETTRGCFSSCAFCVSGAEKPVRMLPLETVRRRIGNIHAHGIREIRLLDRTFNGNTQRAVELLKLFMEFPDMRFHLEVHPAFLSAEIRPLLASLPENLLHVEAGIQSLQEIVLKTCKRAGSLEDALDGLRFLCGLKNMETHVDLIAGLPFYTLEQIYDDIRILSGFGAGEIQLELLKVLPGTAMRRDAGVLGIVYSPIPPYEVLKTRAMRVDEIQTGRRLSRLLDFYYNARAWKGITARLIAAEPGFLTGFLEWLEQRGQLEQPLSVEKRGLLLFEFLTLEYPVYREPMTGAWIKAGLSARKISRFAEGA